MRGCGIWGPRAAGPDVDGEQGDGTGGAFVAGRVTYLPHRVGDRGPREAGRTSRDERPGHTGNQPPHWLAKTEDFRQPV